MRNIKASDNQSIRLFIFGNGRSVLEQKGKGTYELVILLHYIPKVIKKTNSVHKEIRKKGTR